MTSQQHCKGHLIRHKETCCDKFLMPVSCAKGILSFDESILLSTARLTEELVKDALGQFHVFAASSKQGRSSNGIWLNTLLRQGCQCLKGGLKHTVENLVPINGLHNQYLQLTCIASLALPCCPSSLIFLVVDARISILFSSSSV
jgi:hypothetical protein